MRLWNEVPTIFLFAIIFLAVLRDSLQAFWALSGLIALSLLLFIAIKAYRKLRQQS
jgi:putative membrane protein